VVDPLGNVSHLRYLINPIRLYICSIVPLGLASWVYKSTNMISNVVSVSLSTTYVGGYHFGFLVSLAQLELISSSSSSSMIIYIYVESYEIECNKLQHVLC